MFQRKMKAVRQEIHDVFGENAIKYCFITHTDFRNESFIYKVLTCLLCSFINSDYYQNLGIANSILMFSLVPKRMNLCPLKITALTVFDCCINISYRLEDIKLNLD